MCVTKTLHYLMYVAGVFLPYMWLLPPESWLANKLQNVFAQIEQVYLSKLQSVFVQIVINSYLSKLQHAFVQIAKNSSQVIIEVAGSLTN